MGVSAQGAGVSQRGVCGGGGLLPWGVCVPDTPSPREQNDWQTGIKILPCRNNIADGNKGLHYRRPACNYCSPLLDFDCWGYYLAMQPTRLWALFSDCLISSLRDWFSTAFLTVCSSGRKLRAANAALLYNFLRVQSHLGLTQLHLLRLCEPIFE